MTKQIAEVQLKSNDGEQFLSIKLDSEIEDIFETDDTKESEKYTDEDGDALTYYELKPKLKRLVEKYQKQTDNRISLEKYGSELMRGDAEGELKVNCSLVRTKGISEGITVAVDELIAEEDLENWIAGFSSFLQFLYKEYVDDKPTKLRVLLEN